jgi:hypothetical protein
MKSRAYVRYAEFLLGQGWKPSWWPCPWNGKAVKEESRVRSSLRALGWRVPCTTMRVTTNLSSQGKCPIHGEPVQLLRVTI